MALGFATSGSFSRWVTTIGGFTLVSRLLGFLRDILIASSLGAGPVADVFFVAFKFPNFFRRLFAEGAFSAAFIPIFSKELEQEGKLAAKEFAEDVLSALLPALLIFVALAQVLMPWVIFIIAPGFSDNTVKFDLAIDLTRITFPYILFISLVSMLGGVLNSLYRFAAVAATPIILNICLILSLEILQYWTETPGHALAIGVSIAGVIQLLWLVAACERAGFSLRLTFPKFTPKLKKLLILAVPAVLGAGVAQINLLIDIIIASFLPEGSVSFLYYADRISQLPLGVVGIAVGTALLPLLSRQIKSGKVTGALDSQNRALEGAMLLTLPATVAIMILANPIIVVLFERGQFSASDSIQTANALLIYAAGLPAFVLIKVLIPGFFARENTKTPVIIAIICLTANIIANLLLMGPLGHLGIALATSLAAWLNALLLGGRLLSDGYLKLDLCLIRRGIGMLLSSLVMGAIIWIAAQGLEGPLSASLSIKIGSLIGLVVIGIVTYFILAHFFGAYRVSEFRTLFRKTSKDTLNEK